MKSKNKFGQEQKSEILVAAPNRKRAQEEMVGFGLIIIIVAVILLVFLGLTLTKPQKEAVEDYEVNSFIQAFLQYTTDCEDNLEYLSVQKLIFDCNSGEECLDGRSSCEALNLTLMEIVGETWMVGEGRPIQGHELEIIVDDAKMLFFKEGNITQNYRGSSQDFSRRGENYEIFFKAYY